ncbi:MAG: amidophosphoribosyltransferase [Rhodothermia bacterium]
MDRPKEYCGVFGIYNAPNSARLTYFGLHALQHRGQESAGITTLTFDENRKRWTMPHHKGFGLVLDVFTDPSVFETKLLGSCAIGHNRYSTSGSADNPANIQPFVVRYRDGNLAIAHNGNLTNTRELRHRFVDQGTLFQTGTDSELVLHLISHSLRKRQTDQIIDALNQVEGAYSMVLLTDEALVAARDPHGFRPLAIGRLGDPDQPGGAAYCVASETCAFDIIGAEYVRDVEPGEVVIIDGEGCATGNFRSYYLNNHRGVHQCVFEYVYFARPDSMVFGEMTDKVRRKIGKQLAHEAPVPEDPRGNSTIVISVPDSSNTATLGYVSECRKLGYNTRHEIGLIRNHYIGRTFIDPNQNAREMKVRCKFNTVRGVLNDRVVIIVDDSIVRGTTSKQLVRMIRKAGAREVHFRVTSPQVVSPCHYGMDFPSYEELLANRFNGDIDEMTEWLGVNSLQYLSAEGLMTAVRSANSRPHGYCNACFTSNYPVEVAELVQKEEND